jgi:hypothetical protein
MMNRYASKTTVSPDKSMGEIQKILTKYGATKFAYIAEESRVGIACSIANRQVRFVMPLPTAKSFKTENQYNQEIRRLYRALLLTIKSKLESVASGIETFDEAFMAQVVLPNSQTISEWASPQIESAYKDNKMPPLLGNY